MVIKIVGRNVMHYVANVFHAGNLETLCGKFIKDNNYVKADSDGIYNEKYLCKNCKRIVEADLKSKRRN